MNPMGKYSGQGPRPGPAWSRPQPPTGPQVMPGMPQGQPMAPPPGMGGPGSMPAPNTPQVSLPAQGPGPYVPPGAMPGQMAAQQAGMGGVSWQQGPQQQGMAQPGSGAFGQAAPANPFTQRTRPMMADALQARAGSVYSGSSGNGG